MTNGQHIILCGCIELVCAGLSFIGDADWGTLILLCTGIFTILGGLAVHKKEKK